jgi:hypothetical protein
LSRFIDRGAVFAGYVGLGTAVVVVLAFALIVPIQVIVYLLAVPVGLLIGWYANVRAERWRPRGRAFANALWAGAVTALVLAVFYVGVRLLFIYADTGYPDYNRTDPITGQAIPPFCVTGPDCTYQRYVADPALGPGRKADLERAGVLDSASFGRFVLGEHVGGGVFLFGLTLAGAAAAGAWRALAPRRAEPVGAVAS